MSRHCTFCGSKLEDGAKICTNCGRIVSVNPAGQRQQFDQDERQEYIDRSRMQSIPKRVYEHPKRAEAEERMRKEQEAKARRKRNAERRNPPPVNNGYERTPTEHDGSGKEKYGKKKKIIKRVLKIAIILFVIYFAIALFRVISVKLSTYKFETEMTLSNENYGQAINAYFQKGKWKYNIFKNEVSYQGTSQDGDKYVMTFKREDGQTIVNSMTINGEKVKTDMIMKTKVMGMFMAEEKIVD